MRTGDKHPLPRVACKRRFVPTSSGALLLAISAQVFFALGFVNLQATAQSVADAGDSIRGVVISSVNHEPIARALVYSPDNRFATLTNSEGRFEFSLTGGSSAPTDGSNSSGVSPTANPSPSRPYMLTARKPGFMPDPDNPGQNLQIDPIKDLTLTLIPEGLIIGTVTLPTSEPQDGITLQLFRRQVMDGVAHWVPAGGTQSLSDGQFRFADLTAGSYKLLTREQLDQDPLANDPLSVDAANTDTLSIDASPDEPASNSRRRVFGYPPVYYQNSSDFDSASLIQLAPGQTQTVNLTLAKQRYYRVKIPVIASSGEGQASPVNGVRVNVYSRGRKGPGFSLGYNNEDHAIEGLLPNGIYTVEATSFGSNGVSGLQSISIKGGPIDGPAISLVPNASIPVLVKEEFTGNQTVSATWNINGRNVVLKGPRRYVNVTLMPADDVGVHGGATLRDPTKPGDDSLVIDGVAPGSYWVRIHTTQGYAATVHSGNLDLLHQPLVVGLGGTTSPIEITMRDDMAEISGTVEGIMSGSGSGSTSTASLGVTSSTGGPSGVRVYCVPVADSSGQFIQLGVSSDGSFSYSGLAPGAYRLLAFDHEPRDLEYRNAEAMQPYESKGPVVRLVSGQNERIQLQLISTGTNP